MTIHGVEQVRVSERYVDEHPHFYWVIGETKPNSNNFKRWGLLNTACDLYTTKALQDRHPGCKILYYDDKKDMCEA